MQLLFIMPLVDFLLYYTSYILFILYFNISLLKPWTLFQYSHF